MIQYVNLLAILKIKLLSILNSMKNYQAIQQWLDKEKEIKNELKKHTKRSKEDVKTNAQGKHTKLKAYPHELDNTIS